MPRQRPQDSSRHDSRMQAFQFSPRMARPQRFPQGSYQRRNRLALRLRCTQWNLLGIGERTGNPPLKARLSNTSESNAICADRHHRHYGHREILPLNRHTYSPRAPFVGDDFPKPKRYPRRRSASRRENLQHFRYGQTAQASACCRDNR